MAEDGEKFQEDKTSVAGGGGLHVAPGIDRSVVHAHFVVDVRTSGAAADAAIADNLSAFNARARNRGKRRHVRIPGGDTEAVIDYNQAAVTGVVFDDGNDAVGGGVNRCAVVGSNVNAGVERTFTAEGIEPFAEAVRDMTKHRPNRGRIGRIGKAERWKQAQATCGDGDSGGILLEKGIL